MNNTLLLVLTLLVGWMLAGLVGNSGESGTLNRLILDGVRSPLSGDFLSPFLPEWLLKKRAVPISRERNAAVLKSVFEVFDPSLKSFLTSVPIVFDSSADTAKAYPNKGYIGVSPDWDNTVSQSGHRATYEQRGMTPEDPVFINRFKTDLLIHEFLHLLQVRQAIDCRLFYKSVARWYGDLRYGIPSPNGVVSTRATNGRPDTITDNRMKYVLWHELYNSGKLSVVPHDGSWKNMDYGERYRSAKRGVEEFAYIGQEILSSGSATENYRKTGRWSENDWRRKKLRLLEISPEILGAYRGLFTPALLNRDRSANPSSPLFVSEG